jgi:hypothetical protein
VEHCSTDVPLIVTDSFSEAEIFLSVLFAPLQEGGMKKSMRAMLFDNFMTVLSARDSVRGSGSRHLQLGLKRKTRDSRFFQTTKLQEGIIGYEQSKLHI